MLHSVHFHHQAIDIHINGGNYQAERYFGYCAFLRKL